MNNMIELWITLKLEAEGKEPLFKKLYKIEELKEFDKEMDKAVVAAQQFHGLGWEAVTLIARIYDENENYVSVDRIDVYPVQIDYALRKIIAMEEMFPTPK